MSRLIEHAAHLGVVTGGDTSGCEFFLMSSSVSTADAGRLAPTLAAVGSAGSTAGSAAASGGPSTHPSDHNAR